MWEFIAFLIVLGSVGTAVAFGGPHLLLMVRQNHLRLQDASNQLPRDQERREELKQLVHREEVARQNVRVMAIEALGEQVQTTIKTGREKGEIDLSGIKNILSQHALPPGR